MNVVAIVGPTASGKSAVAEALAERHGAVIVSVDSMQAYRRMDIGTAKPDRTVRERVPYRMIDIADPSIETSVQWFQSIGRVAIQEGLDIHGKVIIAGGSGLHFRALVDPMTFAPTDSAVRDRISSVGPEHLKRRLLAEDASVADHVDLDNPRRVLRALEVIELTGMTPTQRAATTEATAIRDYEPFIPFSGFGIDAGDQSQARIAERMTSMLDRGLLAEVEGIEGDLGRTASQAVGYKQLLPVVRGELDLVDGVDAAISATKALAKRQRTYFGRDPRIAWLSWQDDDEARVEQMVTAIGEAAKWTS